MSTPGIKIADAPPAAKTALQIIIDAMRNVGYLGRGQEPSGEQIQEYKQRLNDLCNHIQARYGLKLWIQDNVAVCLRQGQGVYRIGVNGDVPMAKPRRCIEAFYTDWNRTRRPIILMSRNEWNTLSTTTTLGTVTAIFPDKKQLSLDIHVWLVPDATAAQGQLVLVLDKQVPNFSAVTDAMAFPPEWARTLTWGLSDEISIGQPQSVIALCKANAAQYLQELEDWDVEDTSTFFQPDQRGQWTGRRFS